MARSRARAKAKAAKHQVAAGQGAGSRGRSVTGGTHASASLPASAQRKRSQPIKSGRVSASAKLPRSSSARAGTLKAQAGASTKLLGYIRTLRAKGTITAADRTKLALYAQRYRAYQKNAKGHTPAAQAALKRAGRNARAFKATGGKSLHGPKFIFGRRNPNYTGK